MGWNMKAGSFVICMAIGMMGMGCAGAEDTSDLRGEIRYFDESGVPVKKVVSKSLALREGFVGMMVAVYDSLLLAWSPGHPGYFFHVFHVDTGNEIGTFVSKGKGHQEMTSVNCVYQFFKKGPELMTLLQASNEGKLFFWNISRSVEEGITVYDTIVSCQYSLVGSRIFFLPEDTLWVYKSDQIEYWGQTTVATPFYEKRTVG